MLTLKSFVPAYDKVARVEFHPVQPWVVSVTKSDYVSVWDWTTEQVLHEFQLGGTEEELTVDADLARLHAQDPAFTPNPSIGPPSTSKSATGLVRDVKFLDLEVAQAQLSAQHAAVNGTGSPPPSADTITTLKGQRLLVIVCEHKVLIADLLSRKVNELHKAALESKAPTCVAFLFQGGHVPGHGSWVMGSPVLALGCADGVVRLIQLSTMLPVARLISTHKSPITSITAVAGRGVHWETVLAGHQGGSIEAWEPFGQRNIGSGVIEVQPKADSGKAHDKDVVGLMNVVVAESAEGSDRMIMTLGLDGRLLGLDPTSLKEIVKIKMDSKASSAATCLAYSPRGFVSSGTHCLLVGTELGLLLTVHPTSGSIRLAINLQGQISHGLKKHPKIYHCAVHPTQPQMVCVATNAGTALLRLENVPPLAAAPLPLKAPSQALVPAAGGGAGSGMTYIASIGDSVYCVTAEVLHADQPAGAAPAPAAPTSTTAALLSLMDETPASGSGSTAAPPPKRAVGVQVMGSLKICSGKPNVRGHVTVSGDGSLAAVVWPMARQYAVFRMGAAAWEEVERGSGSSVAWHPTLPRFAVLEEHVPPPPEPPSKDKKKGKAAKEAEAKREAEAAAAAAAAKVPPSVKVKEVHGRSVSPMGPPLPLGQDTAVFVTSGPLLGVTLRRQAQQGCDLMTGEAPAVMRFYDWSTGAPVGPELPEPLIVSWDTSLQMCALAYAAQVVVCAARPTFSPLLTLPIASCTGLEWSMRQLYVLTPTHIHSAFIAPRPVFGTGGVVTGVDATAPPAVHLLEVAALGAPLSPPSYGSGTAAGASGSAAADGAAGGCLPAPLPRPPGPLALLGPRDGFLWVLNAYGAPVALPLTHPGLRAFCLAAAGDLAGAVQLACREVPGPHHDTLAAFLSELDGVRGASQALGLTGLSLAAEARLRVQVRQWPQAMEAVEALLAGFTRRPPPGRFAYRDSSAAFGIAGSGLGGGDGGGGGVPGSPLAAATSSTFLDGTTLTALTRQAAGATLDDGLDWSAPLRQATTSAAARAAAALASGKAAGTRIIRRGAAGAAGGAATSGAAPSAAAVDLAMQLMAAVQAIGMADVGRCCAKMLLRYAGALSPRQLSSLAVYMAESGMKTELPQLANQVVVMGADTQARESTGVLAALLSGHTALVQSVFEQNHSLALAAAQAKAFSLTAEASSMEHWAHALGSASGLPHLSPQLALGS